MLALALAACADSSSSVATTTAAPVSSSPTIPATTSPVAIPDGPVATVSGPQSGNRFSEGSFDITISRPVDIPLSGNPVWVVGVPGPTGPEFVVALDDGTLEAWRIGDQGAESIALSIDRLPPGTPPLVVATDAGAAVVAPPADASPLTYPAIVGDRLVYVDTGGNLVISEGGSRVVLEVGALLDTRISVSADGLVSVLSGATDRYPHGVLGDVFEATRIVIIDPAAGAIVSEATIEAPSVIEGIAAPWVDADGDGTQELLATVSNSDVGARLVLFDSDGVMIAEGPPIGRSNRWRNQLGAAPTGPNGEVEVIDVRVPHIGGVVEFFRLDGAELVTETRRSGYTSHVLGSRNLDLALATDLTGDGRIDVLVPTQARDGLGVLVRSNDGVEVVAELAVPGRLATNLVAVSLADGRQVVAAGTDGQVLRVWR